MGSNVKVLLVSNKKQSCASVVSEQSWNISLQMFFDKTAFLRRKFWAAVRANYFSRGRAWRFSISRQPNKTRRLKHLLDIITTTVRSLVIHFSLVYSQAAVVHAYTGLPPVVELTSEAKTCPVNMMPNDRQMFDVIGILKSSAIKKCKKRQGLAHI